MSENTPVVTVGPSFLSLLAILFIGLKLTNFITWPWLWVLSPLWIPLALVLSLLSVFGVLYLFYFVGKKLLK